MKNPLVSVIITCYNLGKFLPESVNSVLSQSYRNIEIIIVDDGSTDKETEKILKKVDGLDSRIKVLRQQNQKLPTARNNGIKNSKGDYIFCLDADDRVSPGYVLECLNEFSRNPEIDIVTTYCQYFGESEDVWKLPEPSISLLIIRNAIHGASFFKRRVWEKCGGYDTAFNDGFEDWEFWINAAEKGFKWSVVPKPLFFYRIRQNSMFTESTKKHKELYEKIVNKHKSLYRKFGPEIAKLTQNMILEKDKKIVELHNYIDGLNAEK